MDQGDTWTGKHRNEILQYYGWRAVTQWRFTENYILHKRKKDLIDKWDAPGRKEIQNIGNGRSNYCKSGFIGCAAEWFKQREFAEVSGAEKHWSVTCRVKT